MKHIEWAGERLWLLYSQEEQSGLKSGSLPFFGADGNAITYLEQKTEEDPRISMLRASRAKGILVASRTSQLAAKGNIQNVSPVQNLSLLTRHSNLMY